MTSVRVGIIQIGRVESLEEGIAGISGLASTLGRVDVAALPELWLLDTMNDDDEGKLTAAASDIASRIGGVLVTGGYRAVRDGRVNVVARAISADGIVAEASKRFPSHAIGERLEVSPGRGPTTFDHPAGRAGVVICVDAIYPELVRRPVLSGATVIINVANISFDRIYLWRALSQTRAAENTVFFVFVNLASGRYPDGRAVEGNSLVATPEGKIVLELRRGETAEVVVLDSSEVERIRRRWLYLEDIRREYGKDNSK